MVTIGDGSRLPIMHVGSTMLPTKVGNIVIDDIFVVPKMKKNLLFVFKFYNDTLYNVKFDNQKFIIKDHQT
jgi:hypothetical protein